MINKMKERLLEKPQSNKTIAPVKAPKLIRYSILLLVCFVLLSLSIIIGRVINQAPNIDIIIDSQSLDKAQIKELNQVVLSQPKGSFFTTDLKQIYEQVTLLPWVEQIKVNRDWKQGVHLQVIPRQPVARFGSKRLLDAQGEAYIPAGGEVLTDSSLVSLEGSPEQAEIIMKQMQQVNEWFAPLELSVKKMVLTPRMTWLIKFNSGLKLLVDGENTSHKLWTVSHVLQNQLADKQHDIKSIDLRYKNGFAISWKY